MKRLKCIVLSAIILFLFTACSNQTFDNAIEKGFTSLEEKKYSTAVSYFEIALEEKDRPEVKSYLEQARLLNDAHNSMNDKDYHDALNTVFKIEKLGDLLSVVKTNASDLKKQISEEQQSLVYENEFERIYSLIDEGNYEMGESELEILKNTLDGNSAFTAQLDDLTQLLSEVTTKQVSQSEESVHNQRKAEGNAQKPTDSGQNPKGKLTYQTYTNTRFGFTVEYPTSFTVGPAPAINDGREFYNEDFQITAYGSHMNIIEENETIETYYNRALGYAPVPVDYQRLGNDRYTVSYVTDGNIIYEKSIVNDGVIFTLHMEYPSSQKSKYDELVTRVAKTFRAGQMD